MTRRRGRRFTPKLLSRFDSEGRGTGTHDNFASYHQVGRVDPGSKGVSTILPAREGFSAAHRLSEVENLGGFFVWMHPYLDDARSQYRLHTKGHAGALSEYLEPASSDYFTGTLQIAANLGIRHPVVRSKGVVVPWRLTTDIVATIRPPGESRQLLAISIKEVPLEKLAKRERALLAIEREYWLSQTHEWLLITPEVYDPLIGLAVKYNSGWALGSAPKSDDLCEEGARLVKRKYSLNFTQSYALLAAELQCGHEEAQAIFWQAVWRGYLPIDLRQTFWPSNQLCHVSLDAFYRDNPVISRRSAWKA